MTTHRLSSLSAVVATLVLTAGCNKSSEGNNPAEPGTAQQAEQKAPAAPPAEQEIKLGQTMPYSGPASAYGTIGKLQTAYFKMINDEGGINGKKIKLISLDDGYSPPKTVEQTRKLVEEEQVIAVFQPLGTAANSSIQKYLNSKKVPQLFVSTGATRWGDPKGFPWTIGFNPSYQLEGQVYAKHILANFPKSKIAVLYQNDDYGKDLMKGLKDGLGDKASMVVAEASYEPSDPTIDSQIVTLKASKADVFVNVTTPKFGAQAVRKVFDIGWKPKAHYLNNVAASIGSVLTPAGLDKSVGLLSTAYFKDPTDKQWDNDAAVTKFKQFMTKYYPEGTLADGSNTYAYIAAQTMVQVLKQCNGEFTSENIMKQAASLKDFKPDLLNDGIAINTSSTDFFPFDQLQLARFDGKSWVVQGDVISVAKID
jgi:ABC-type branched-subunit amino acid transport system substrate-binding protein